MNLNETWYSEFMKCKQRERTELRETINKKDKRRKKLFC